MMLQFGREISFAMLDLWLQCGQYMDHHRHWFRMENSRLLDTLQGSHLVSFSQHSSLFTTPRKMASVLPSANHFPLHQLFLEMCFVN